MTEENTSSYVELTAAEISNLWRTYQADSIDICGISFFLIHAEDPEIRQVLEKCLQIVKDNKQQLEQIFNYENYPIPQAFSEKDINFNAPRLFSDKLYLHYILNLADIHLLNYSANLAMAARTDIIDFYSKELQKTQKLYQQIIELVESKGIYIRTPSIPKANKVEFVKKESFLSGWFGNRRPLLGLEIAHLSYASRRNSLGQAVITGFSQVAKSKEIRKFFEKGRDISGRHKNTFTDILNENYLSDGMLMTSEVTDSTVSPFSDKLMMTLVTVLNAAGIAQYGIAISASPRHDLGLQYTKLAGEIAKYSNEGASIMIENGWMEQPPIAADRESLAKR